MEKRGRERGACTRAEAGAGSHVGVAAAAASPAPSGRLPRPPRVGTRRSGESPSWAPSPSTFSPGGGAHGAASPGAGVLWRRGWKGGEGTRRQINEESSAVLLACVSRTLLFPCLFMPSIELPISLPLPHIHPPTHLLTVVPQAQLVGKVLDRVHHRGHLDGLPSFPQTHLSLLLPPTRHSGMRGLGGGGGRPTSAGLGGAFEPFLHVV